MMRAIIPCVRLPKIRLAPLLIQRIVMSLHQQDSMAAKPLLAMETGVHLALEDGGRILIERGGTKLFPPRPPANYPALLLEDSNKLLQEDFFPIILENNN